MKIAILGATSQIAKDLVQSFSKNNDHDLVLFARRPEVVSAWLYANGMADRYETAGFAGFTTDRSFDAVINFVGVGDPAQAAAMGASILDITFEYDGLALSYITANPSCRYIFLSSGAAYGGNFDQPVDADREAIFSINNLVSQDWYGIAKLHAECRHRSQINLPIIDIRVFNYFSNTQDISARFLITDILRSVLNGDILQTSSDLIVRDFLHPADFYNLITAILLAPAINTAIDCYSLAPVDKFSLLDNIQKIFGLRYEIVEKRNSVNATGNKTHYYSKNKLAEKFGYNPTFTSIQGIEMEFNVVVKRHQNLNR